MMCGPATLELQVPSAGSASTVGCVAAAVAGIIQSGSLPSRSAAAYARCLLFEFPRHCIGRCPSEPWRACASFREPRKTGLACGRPKASTSRHSSAYLQCNQQHDLRWWSCAREIRLVQSADAFCAIGCMACRHICRDAQQ